MNQRYFLKELEEQLLEKNIKKINENTKIPL